ncbi:GL20971 [Drosophila persimilis]|uniref:GL20971 n=1 Tax=Drosophila persimilis TaxID=7234 RepID=B4HCE9_DROPE|nr:GL20971 [Drosophila persimilis]
MRRIIDELVDQLNGWNHRGESYSTAGGGATATAPTPMNESLSLSSVQKGEGAKGSLQRLSRRRAPAKAHGSRIFQFGPDGKEKERMHSHQLELLKNLGTRANELVKRMNDQRQVDNVDALQALVVKNFDKLHTRKRRQDGKLTEVGENVNKIRWAAKSELLLELNGASKSNTAKLKDISAELKRKTEELCVEFKDLDSLVTKEDIAAAIAATIDAPSVDSSAIKILSPSFASTQLAVVCLTPVQARALLELGKLKVCWTSCRIRETML